MPEEMTFSFKGNRDYVQGTTLFNMVVQKAAEYGLAEGTLNIMFKSKISSPVCILERRSALQTDAMIARLAGSDGTNIDLCLNAAPEKGQPVSREAFDESEVCRGAVMGDKSIIQEKPHHRNRIELLVSLCKKMHLACIDSDKKWVFSRFDGNFPIPAPENVELRVIKQVGTRLTCTEALINGSKIGDIYFS